MPVSGLTKQNWRSTFCASLSACNPAFQEQAFGYFASITRGMMRAKVTHDACQSHHSARWAFMTIDRLPTLDGQSYNGGAVLARRFSIWLSFLRPKSVVRDRIWDA